LSLPSSSHHHSSQCLTAIMCHNCCLIVTIVAVAIPSLQLLYHCIIATLLPMPSSLPQSYHVIVVAVTLLQPPFHHCSHCCSCHTIIVAIASLSPQLLYHHCHHCVIVAAVAMPSLPPSCHCNCCHSTVIAIDEVVMPSLLPS